MSDKQPTPEPTPEPAPEPAERVSLGTVTLPDGRTAEKFDDGTIEYTPELPEPDATPEPEPPQPKGDG